MVTKLKSKNYITKNFKISKKFFIIIDRIITQKLPILKQGVKTINAEFIRTRALSQLSFIQFRPYATSFPGLLLSLTLMPKSKKDPGNEFGLYPVVKTSVDARIKGLISNLDYLENRVRNFIQKKYGRRRLPSHTRFIIWSAIFFCMVFLHH